MPSYSSTFFSSSSISSSRLRIYSLFRWRSLISATYSACSLSIPKPIIRFGTTSASSSVSRTILIALSMSSRILPSPFNKCNLLFALSRSNKTRLLTHSIRKADHSSSTSRIPRTRGEPPIRMFILTENVSSSVVDLKSFCINLSGSTPFFISMVIFNPPRPVSSRISLISVIFFVFERSTIFSIICSQVVVGGI